MNTSDEVTRILRELLPPGVAVATGNPADDIDLHPEEAPLVARAVLKRQREFAMGRACARRALTSLGGPAVAIAIGPKRQPRWPPGYVGSLTHTDGFCAAAVARTSDFRSLGIDAEPDVPLLPAVAAAVLGPSERLAPADPVGLDPGTFAHAVFSAKEAVYKCQFPLTETFLEFSDLRVELTPDRFRAVLERPVASMPAGFAFEGRWARRAGLILTTTWLPLGSDVAEIAGPSLGGQTSR